MSILITNFGPYISLASANVCLGELEMGEERWRKDEILAAKIKKFLSVSLHAVHVSVCIVLGWDTTVSVAMHYYNTE